MQIIDVAKTNITNATYSSSANEKSGSCYAIAKETKKQNRTELGTRELVIIHFFGGLKLSSFELIMVLNKTLLVPALTGR